MEKGLLIHAYDRDNPNWIETVWGVPPDRPGRLVTGAKVILEESIDLALICGSSDSKKEKKDCYLMRNKLCGGLDKLGEFTIYPVFQNYSVQQIREKINLVLRVMPADPGADTFSELSYALGVFHDSGIKKVYLVSSPDHIVRCLRDALLISQNCFPDLAPNIYASASATLYSGRVPKDKTLARMENVVVLEPQVINIIDFPAIIRMLGNPLALAELKVLLRKYGE